MARKKPAKKNNAATEGPDFSFLGSKDESPDERTVESRRRLRELLSTQVEEFLAKGGKIETVSSDMLTSPPKRPESNYGNRPI
ncbi:MAG: hypothetical protein OXC07_05655 [Kistimonas sp.]|nr:hypothetical protein [Kistimonas sp.]